MFFQTRMLTVAGGHDCGQGAGTRANRRRLQKPAENIIPGKRTE